MTMMMMCLSILPILQIEKWLFITYHEESSLGGQLYGNNFVWTWPYLAGEEGII